MTAPNTQLTGRELLRVSLDKSGRQKSNGQQTKLNRAQGPDWGITSWLDPYSEVGSASSFRRRDRAEFPQLLEDLASGAFRADVLVLWEASRGSRDLEEWLPLLKLCARARVMIGVTNLERLFRPWVAQDRRDLIDLAADAELESARISQRVTRDASEAAVNGRPHGRTPYGYKRSYDPTTGEVKWSPQPEEAEVVRELYKRVAGGEDLAAIARDFRARGITSRGSRAVAARPFSPQTLRGMALAPVYAGLRVHGARELSRAQRGTQAKTYRGTWDALVSDDLFYAVKARLADPARRTSRPGRGVHLLSMLATCDVCGSPLAATYRKGPRAYQCHQRGCVKVNADKLDAWVEEQVLGYLSRDDVFDRIAEASSTDLQAARDEVARLSAERAAALTALESDDDPAVAQALARRAGRQLAEAQERLEELSTPAALRGLITPGAVAAQEWEAALTPKRREVVRALFAPGLLKPLSIARQTPGTRTGREPVEARVRLGGEPLEELPAA